MNLDTRPTIDQLRELIRACDDVAGDHVLWVTKDGEVRISDVRQNQSLEAFERAHPDMQLRCETFVAGNEYVGPDAARDDDWLTELFKMLQVKWSEAKGKSAVEYIGGF